MLHDILCHMLAKPFVVELFKPQEIYSKKAMRTVFDHLAHSSIMRLNTGTAAGRETLTRAYKRTNQRHIDSGSGVCGFQSNQNRCYGIQSERERERERDRERQKEKDRKKRDRKKRERERQREIDRQAERQTDRQRIKRQKTSRGQRYPCPASLIW